MANCYLCDELLGDNVSQVSIAFVGGTVNYFWGEEESPKICLPCYVEFVLGLAIKYASQKTYFENKAALIY